MMTKTPQPRILLTHLFRTGLNAVQGQLVVEQHLKRHPLHGDIAIVAIGKAASAMMSGAEHCLNDQIHSALVISKDGHCDVTLSWPCLEAGHPVPDQRSLDAGTKLLEFITNLPVDMPVLVLISGGASALVDILPDSMTLQDLQHVNEWLLASGLPIEEMNRVRQSVSKIKGGKLLHYVSTKKVTQLIISDVKNDDPELVGSGLFVVSRQQPTVSKLPGWLKKFLQPPTITSSISANSYIVANNTIACLAIIEQAKCENIQATYHGQTLYGDIHEVVEQLVLQLSIAPSGIHVWGGETTLTLPDVPGRGGRNQSLALAIAIALQARNGITVLVGATDGTDGPTEDAGAIVDCETVRLGEVYPGYAKERLLAADAGTFLEEAGALLSTGPTGTNVMDLVIAFKE